MFELFAGAPESLFSRNCPAINRGTSFDIELIEYGLGNSEWRPIKPRRMIMIVQANCYYHPSSNIGTSPALCSAEVFAANFKVAEFHDWFQ
jgi:hypothetical protein